MNEQEALRVILVKSFETAANREQLLSSAERHEATRTALEQVGPRGAPDAFIAARAQAVTARLDGRGAKIAWALKWRGWHNTWLLLAIAIGLLLGITADVFGSGTQLNLLAPPAWLVILWNVAMYLLLCAQWLKGGSPQAARAPQWIARAAHWLNALQFRHVHKRVPANTQSRALADFGLAWTRANRPLATLRLVTLLHAAAAAVAVALITGMYLRGLVFDYRVEWGSTFMDTQTVHTLLSCLFAPALSLSGIALPDVAQMEALRDASQLGREQATAAPWIHLYAITLLVIVVLPRTLLASWNGWRAQRLAAHFPLPLDDQYFRRLLRTQSGEPTRICVLPYAQSLAGEAQENLRRILALAFENSPHIEFATTTPQGAEEALDGLPASLAHATHLLAVFDLTATPEAEYHGAFLKALAAVAQAPLIIVLNESQFASRFRDYPQRLAERRQAWTTFAGTTRTRPLFADLAAPDLATCANELRKLVDELTES